MIKILKNQTNNIVFTLDEKTTISNVNYLLELFSNQNHDSKVVRLTGETSANIKRYNQFPITESTTDNLNIGQINLNAGTYDYYVWQTSATTLALSSATSIIESGKCVVIGSATTEVTFTNNNNEYTFN